MALAKISDTAPSSPLALARSISGEMPIVGQGGNGAESPASVQPTPEAEQMNELRLDQRYKFVRLIGRGSMGTVFLAKHEGLGSAVAIKVMHAKYAKDSSLRQRFLNEAHVGSVVKSDHIVKVSDCDILSDDRPYFVMEYVTGPTLAESLRQPELLSVTKALRIARGVTNALKHTHERGIVHRDLKPENILLMDRPDDHDFVKVLDFGIAKLEQSSAGLHEVGLVLGTPQYLSPEQAFGREVDHRADVYSLGVMLYEMLAGETPFHGDTAEALVTQHRHSLPIPLRNLRGMETRVSLKLEHIVQTCLEKAPEARYQSMAKLAEALKEAERDIERRRKSKQTRQTLPPSSSVNNATEETSPAATKARQSPLCHSLLDSSNQQPAPTTVPTRWHELRRIVPILLLGVALGATTSAALQWFADNSQKTATPKNNR